MSIESAQAIINQDVEPPDDWATLLRMHLE